MRLLVISIEISSAFYLKYIFFIVVTVWSAPNYCYRCGNVASIMQVDENLDAKYTIFYAVKESAKSQPYRNVQWIFILYDNIICYPYYLWY